MTQRKKFELEINTPTEISLLFDTPIVGESQYGSYQMYAVESFGNEFSYFAPEIVHEKLKELKKGDSAIVTKLAAQRKGKVITTYDVQVPQKVTVAKEAIIPSQQSIDQDSNDHLYQIMLQSYKDAIDISNELSGLADPGRIAISLFIARSKSNSYGG